MADVATQAGVSRTLVSFILDGKPGASEETKQRVLAVAEELGYRPDSAARLLARGRSRTLGVLMDVRSCSKPNWSPASIRPPKALGYEVLLSANLPDRAESVPIDALAEPPVWRSDPARARRPTPRTCGSSPSRSRSSSSDADSRDRPGLATVRTDDAKGIRLGGRLPRRPRPPRHPPCRRRDRSRLGRSPPRLPRGDAQPRHLSTAPG